MHLKKLTAEKFLVRSEEDVYTERNGMRLHYRVFGLENSLKSPLVFLIHGATGDATHYNTVATELSRLGCRVVACDIRYHGLSQPNTLEDSFQFSFQDALDDIDWVVLKLKEKYYGKNEIPLFIGGLSMGGMLSLIYASQNEKNDRLQRQNICLKGIVLISVIFPSLLDSRVEWKMFKNPVFNQDLINFSKQNIVNSSKLMSSQIDIRRSMQHVPDKIIHQCLSSVANSLLADLGNDEPPTRLATLLIIPEKDEYTQSDMNKMYEINKKQDVVCEKVVIKEALHMVILDEGAEVAKHIASFCLSQ